MSFITSPAIIKPATDGTKETLPGIEHLPFSDIGVSGQIGSSLEYASKFNPVIFTAVN